MPSPSLAVRTVWRLQAILFSVFWRGTLVPVEYASKMGGMLLGIVGPRLASSRKIATNMHVAFPDKSPVEIAGLVQAAWHNFGRMLMELPYETEIGRTRVDVLGSEHLMAIRASGKPCVVFSAHVGNWELAALPLAQLGMPIAVIYSPVKNPIIDRIAASEAASWLPSHSQRSFGYPKSPPDSTPG